MNELKNITITKVEIGEENTLLVFTGIDERSKLVHVNYQTNGDCCSTCWFSHITGIRNLLDQKVIGVVEREEFSDEEQKNAEAEGNYDSLDLYGYILKTEKGVCDIEFRNDSNGYYGGSCDKVNYPTLKELKEVTEDL